MVAASQTAQMLLLVEPDVIVRFVLADYLRGCGHTVVEASSAQDAKAVLVAGPTIDVMMADAQLAGDENGFALAQWVRRHRTNVEVILTSSVINKAQAATQFCSRSTPGQPNSDASNLATRIHTMMAERKRRMRPQSNTAALRTARRRRLP